MPRTCALQPPPPPSPSLPAQRVVRNRDFNPLSLRGDVGLLLLKAPITNIQPAALPPPDLEIPEGEVLLTAGFGLQENQRAASRLM